MIMATQRYYARALQREASPRGNHTSPRRRLLQPSSPTALPRLPRRPPLSTVDMGPHCYSR